MLVVDKKNHLLGTITDGDIRRSILNNYNINNKIDTIYCKDYSYIYEDQFSLKKAKRIVKKEKLNVLPIISSEKKIVRYYTWESLFASNKINKPFINKDVDLVIMAGGKGTRLEPFTKILPKPLIPINEKPIIDYIIDKFVEIGIKKVSLTINYKSRLLVSYFEEKKPKYKVNFIKESKPLGTAGSLYFLRNKIKKPFFLTNCDNIIKANLLDLYNFHISKKNNITIVVSAKEFVIPYGVCNIDSKGILEKIQEKPKFDFLINTGLYVINPSVLKLVPKNKFFNMTDLLDLRKFNSLKVGIFPINEHAWIDIGKWNEYKDAIKKL